ncbi:hypothetical protein [Flavihumibacter sp. UBA7668]|uniref:hypothetical protein n=1 Tax=Flavihumibacter sp. UBA7668 TaxID=1946542 RepID=UPI0025C442C8|nr:hypothetical protein [Flavihumibacter sp. UBA7668]
MDRVKLQLSEEEKVLVGNPSVILTKNRILEKVDTLLGMLSEQEVARAELLRNRLPKEFFLHPPKISKGDQYRQMPWLMLDFPRCFQSGQILAIRQFFWWGHLFSSSLLVSGQLKELITDKDWIQLPGLYICVHASPWEHHFEADNFRLVASLSAAEYQRICQKQFIKLAFLLPISHWEQVPDFYNQSFSAWMQLLAGT